jgi:KDO2-lipid IV(A) lauroyltransferase
LVVCVLQALPMSVCHAVARWGAWLFGVVLRVRHNVVEENLRQAFPERSTAQLQQIIVGMWEHLLLMVVEIAHAPRKIHRTTWKDFSTLPADKSVFAHLLDERPLVAISGHHGNFELGGYLLALHGFPTYTVARTLDNPFLDRYVNGFRESKGQYILSKQGSGGEIAQLLEQGKTIALLGDQHAGSRGCWVDFFGRPASTNKAVAVLSLGSQAPTVVTAAVRRGRPMHFEIEVSGVVDPASPKFQLGSVPLMIEWYARCLEDLIRRDPEQYWWLHRRWRFDPPTAAERRIRRDRRKVSAA